MNRNTLLYASCLTLTALSAATGEGHYDLIIRGGTVYDGTGIAGTKMDIAINGDAIATMGDLSGAAATQNIDATGLAVSPGFINMLSWATESLLHDPKSQSDIRQGVTLEVFGEGWSMGPLTEAMQRDELESQGDIKYEIPWAQPESVS